jgi:hypothetical protein
MLSHCRFSAAGQLMSTQFMAPLVRLQRLYQMRPLRMLDTAKKSCVIRM